MNEAKLKFGRQIEKAFVKLEECYENEASQSEIESVENLIDMLYESYFAIFNVEYISNSDMEMLEAEMDDMVDYGYNDIVRMSDLG